MQKLKYPNKSHPKHGLSNHRLYGTWKNMMDRCYKQEAINYLYYGGRGIKVCERWHNIRSFIEDVGNKPSQQHTLDRINTDKDYAPDNCRWATKKEQSHNMRNNKLFKYRGGLFTIPQLSDMSGISRQTIYSRIHRDNRTVTEAITKGRLCKS